MPVVSILIRLMIGCVQMFDTPGSVVAASSSPISFSRVMPGRHSRGGFRFTTVSVMLTGAGSVEVSARAILATTDATSGNFPMASFCLRAISMACPRPIAGSVTGMNIRSPSLSGGMNSVPMRGSNATAPTTTRRATLSVARRCRNARSSTGR